MRQVLRAGALGWPIGLGWGGWWEGASGWGTHVNPWLIHVNVCQKSLQYCKIISLQLIKINEIKIKNKICGWYLSLVLESFQLLFLQIFLLSHSLPAPSVIPIICMSCFLILSKILGSFCSYICVSICEVSIDLSPGSLISPSVILNLLLSLSKLFFISNNVLLIPSISFWFLNVFLSLCYHFLLLVHAVYLFCW